MSRIELDDMGVLSLRGPDARGFLQGQLTNDLDLLTDERSLLAAVANAQGRVLAVVRVIAIDDGALLWLPLSEVADLSAHLSRFVLRARVILRDESASWRAVGIAGREEVTAFVREAGARLGPPATVSRRDGLSILTLDDTLSRAVALTTRADLDRVSAARGPDALAAWQLEEIRAGLPAIAPLTRAMFVPQMLNLDLLGAISFGKGCYTGQEVVARTQHLGRIKRRMLRARGACAPPSPGTPVLASGGVTGHVVRAEVDEHGGCELLATVSLADREHALALEGGASIELLSLPYAIPEIAATV